MFEIGQNARISSSAFPNSDNSAEIRARGQTGRLIGLAEDDEEIRIWIWQSSNGDEVLVPELELERGAPLENLK